jgi:hypothetical protein
MLTLSNATSVYLIAMSLVSSISSSRGILDLNLAFLTFLTFFFFDVVSSDLREKTAERDASRPL